MTIEAIRVFTVDDYEKMGAAGIFAPEERVELIEGVIRPMAPIGASHAWIVDLITIAFIAAFAADYTITIQNPIHLSDYSEPQPDVAVIAKRPKGVTPYKPIPKDVFVVVEVSDNTLYQDRNIKLPLYAAAGIPEVWIIDVTTMVVEQYTTPTDDGYSQMNRWRKGDMIPTTLGVSIAAEDVLV